MAILANQLPKANLTFTYDNGNTINVGTLVTGGPRQYNTSVWGSFIPLSEGYRAIPGAVVWAGSPVVADERNLLQGSGVDAGLKAIQYRTWNVKRAAAFALGYRLNPNGNPPTVRRIWINGSLAYSEGNSQPVTYNNFHQIYLPAGVFVNGTWVPNDASNSSGNTFGDAQTIWAANGSGLAGSAGMVQRDPSTGRFLGQTPVTSTISFRFYNGSETQVPDEAIVAELGSDAPSFRGMMYLVIDDLVVGQGFEQNNLFYPDVNVYGATKTGYQNVQSDFPVVRVELVDNGTSTVYSSYMLTTNPPVNFAYSNDPIPNWDTGELATIVPETDGGGYLHRYDMATKAETLTLPITGHEAGERIVSTMWDQVNDWFFCTPIFGSHAFLTVDKNGQVISQFHNGDPTIGQDGTNPTSETNPTPNFNPIVGGKIGYAVVNGTFESVVFGHTSSEGRCACIHVNADGTFPGVLYPRALIDVPSPYTFSDSTIALPLWVHATQDQHLSYQDCCFLHCYGSSTIGQPGGARLVFVGIDPDGSCHVKGTQSLMTGLYNGSSIAAMMDASGNLILQEQRSGIDPMILHKFKVDYLGAPDFNIAPGWRGLFPVVTPMFDKSYSSTLSIDINYGAFANVSNNNYVQGTRRLDLNTLEVKDIGGISVGGYWDSTSGIMYYVSNISQSAPDPVFVGRGLGWSQVIGGLTGSIPSLSTVLQDLSVAAGFTGGDLNVDSNLTTGVPGVLITGPMDMGTLFNSMGAIYEFSYFNSGGKLTFRSSTNTPTYASGSVGISGSVSSHINMQDGDTVTIGSVTYRFKTTPAAPFDVKLGVDTSVFVPDGFTRSIGNLYAAIKGDSTIGADPVPFFPGTVVNPDVTVKPDPQSSVTNFGYGKLIVTSKVGGVAGNSIALASTSGGRIVLSGSHLTNGAEPPAPSINITLDNLCMVGENQITDTDALITQIPPPGQSQSAAAVTYYALEQDYSPLKQTYTPDNLNGALVDSTATTTYDLPIVMSTSEAYARVSKTAFSQADASITQEFRLPQAYLAIEPNDVIGITIAPFQYTIRVDEATFNGDFSMSVSGTNFSARTDVPINNSDSKASIPQTIPSAGDALPLFLDAPILNQAQGTFAGSMDFSIGLRPYYTTFRSGVFLAGAVPGEPNQLFTTTETVKWGKISGPIPAFNYPGYVIEEDSITIACRSLSPTNDLQSATDETSFIAGENCLAVGSGTNWEYIFFRDVEPISSTSVRLTGLIRAQRGTEIAAASHTDSDYAVLVASANPNFVPGLRTQSMDVSQHNVNYAFVASGSPSSRPPAQETDFVKGYSLYPFAPCLLSATLAAGNDLDLAWVRRDRLSAQFVTNNATLAETSEKYDLEIMNGSTVVRTLLDLTSPAYTYTSTQQAADGFTPPLATIKFRVYQKGELGRGFVREETVNVD